VAKITAVSTEDVVRAAGNLFRAAPTLATMGPAKRVLGLSEIVEKLAA
jgi:predicted Zn-dependent peptidase